MCVDIYLVVFEAKNLKELASKINDWYWSIEFNSRLNFEMGDIRILSEEEIGDMLYE